MFHTSMKKCENTCLQQGSFTLFTTASAEASKTRNFTYNLDVHYTYRDVYFEEDIRKDEGYFMAQYCPCDDWIHRKCLLVPNEIFLHEQKLWHCVGCKYCK